MANTQNTQKHTKTHTHTRAPRAHMYNTTHGRPACASVPYGRGSELECQEVVHLRLVDWHHFSSAPVPRGTRFPQPKHNNNNNNQLRRVETLSATRQKNSNMRVPNGLRLDDDDHVMGAKKKENDATRAHVHDEQPKTPQQTRQ